MVHLLTQQKREKTRYRPPTAILPLPPTKPPPSVSLKSIIIVKYLIRVLQYRIHDSHLPPSIRDVRPRRRAHEGGPKHNGQVLRAHAVCRRVLDDAMQVQGQGAQSGIVGIWQAVNDGMQGVAADNVVFVFYEQRLVKGRRKGCGERSASNVLAASMKAE